MIINIQEVCGVAFTRERSAFTQNPEESKGCTARWKLTIHFRDALKTEIFMNMHNEKCKKYFW
jgi:hypothetical protein